MRGGGGGSVSRGRQSSFRLCSCDRRRGLTHVVRRAKHRDEQPSMLDAVPALAHLVRANDGRHLVLLGPGTRNVGSEPEADAALRGTAAGGVLCGQRGSATRAYAERERRQRGALGGRSCAEAASASVSTRRSCCRLEDRARDVPEHLAHEPLLPRLLDLHARDRPHVIQRHVVLAEEPSVHDEEALDALVQGRVGRVGRRVDPRGLGGGDERCEGHCGRRGASVRTRRHAGGRKSAHGQ